jgi:hydrogenase maturation protease
MNDQPQPHIALLGLGNLMRTDDAVGMLAIRHLAESRRLSGEVRFIEGGTLGLDLLDSLRSVSHLLALDAVDTGAAPGTLIRFDGDELQDLPVSKSVHLLGFADLMSALRLMDAAPEKVMLLGVQPSSTEWGTVLTSLVDASMAQLMDLAVAQVWQWQRTPFRAAPVIRVDKDARNGIMDKKTGHPEISDGRLAL